MVSASLYDRLGGPQAVGAAVAMFYTKVMNDSLLAPLFKGVDLQALAQHQFDFMRYAFGGTDTYSGRDLHVAHFRLVRDKGMNETHFDKVAQHLRATLMELKIENSLVEEVMAVVMSTRDDVLGLREMPS